MATRKSQSSARGKTSARGGRSSSSSSSKKDSTSKTTTDHDEIRQWAEERGGKPACVIGTGGGGDTGLLRIDFPGYSGESSLQEISWDEFFEKFDEQGLALLHQDETASGQKSNFNKLVNRDNAKHNSKGRHGRAAK